MRIQLAMILTMTTVLAASATAAAPDGRHAIRGAGLLNCSNFVEERERESPAYLMIGGWIDGYITGINQYRADTYDITSYESTELIARIIENHCKKNPDDRLFTVLNSLFTRNAEDRIRESMAPVTVTVGDRTTHLYRPTIRRIQNELRQRRLYSEDADGMYDAGVTEAMAEFQKELDFEPTGFPDQATLWFLLNSPSGKT